MSTGRSRHARFRGVAHVHSTRSFDGSCSYAELRALFLEAGLNFACMTEHIEGLTQSDIDAILEECERHSDGQFLFIPGIEMDCFTIYFLGVSPTTVDFASNETIYESLQPRSKLCVLSHPIKAKFRYPDGLAERCQAVEILNAKHDGKFYFRPQSEELLRQLRARRSEVVPIVGLDFHFLEQMCSIHMRLIQEGPLNPDFVLSEIGAGRVDFYDGDTRLGDVGALERLYRVSRLRLMDFSHFVHRSLRGAGVRVPGVIRRPLSRFLEGG